MRKVILLSTALMLSGCASMGKWFADDPVEAIPVIEKFTLLPASQPEAIQTKEVTFNVISKQKFMKSLMEKYNLPLDVSAAIAKEVFEDDISLFTVNAKNYGNLGENMQEILRFIKEQREVVDYYRTQVPVPTKTNDKDKN